MSNSSVMLKDAVPGITANSAFAQSRVFVGEHSPWIHFLQNRFNELGALPRGWDGYNGLPVRATVLMFAADIMKKLYVPGLKAPALVPGADGTLQIEWHSNQFDIELDVLGVNQIHALRFDCETGVEETADLSNDVSIPAVWIHEMVARSQVAAANV